MVTFPKNERLTGKKEINKLFEEGKSFNHFPFRVIWYRSDEAAKQAPAKVLISVPKKIFKRAVDRNHIKRRTKEAYRKNKEALMKHFKDKGVVCYIGLIYIAKEVLTAADIEKKMVVLLKRLIDEEIGW